MRAASVSRRTAETDVAVSLTLDGSGTAAVSTGVGFLDHMLELFARHGLFDLDVKVTGDLQVDQHHTTEDTGIALGQAFAQALSDKKGIVRYADVHLPMDETLTRVALDISGRPFLVFKAVFPSEKIGVFDTELVREFFQAFRHERRRHLARRVAVRRPTATTSPRAASRAWRARCGTAVRVDPREGGRVPSTKGAL
jgi:imidazoleglycerol-phosphate dehydratase